MGAYKLMEATGLNRLRFHTISVNRYRLVDAVDNLWGRLVHGGEQYNLLMTFNNEAMGVVDLKERPEISGAKSAELWRVAVKESRRSEGHGHHLLKLTEKFAQRQGYRMLVLSALPDPRVVKFYKENGYEECDWEEYEVHGMNNGLTSMIKHLKPVVATSTSTGPCVAGNGQPAHTPAWLPQPVRP